MERIGLFLLVLLSLSCSCMNNGKSTMTTEETMVQESFEYPKESIPVDSDYVHACMSEDGNMMFYSWDTYRGGTCPLFEVLCQFRTEEGKVVIEDLSVKEGEPAWVDEVHSIKKEDGTVYYITKRHHRASSNDGYMWMDGFMIDGDTLRNVSVYDAGDDLDECGLVVNYFISRWSYTTNGEGWDWLFEYDTETKDLYVPITTCVDEESFPLISDRYKVLHFNGMEFVDKGESPHKGLHPSLSSYHRLAKYFRTENYIVRVDEMDGGDYRYASWKSTSSISEKPELVINGGRRDEEEDCYSFVNDGVEYIVGYEEKTPISEGCFESHEFLLVKKNGKILLKEERL